MAAKPEFAGVVDQLGIGPEHARQGRRRVARALRRDDGFLRAARGDRRALAAASCGPSLPDPDLALRYFWQAIAALYPKIGFPDLAERGDARRLAQASRRPTGRRSWRRPSLCDDEHDISLTFSAHEEWKLYGDPLYKLVAARRVRLDRVTRRTIVLADARLPDGSRVDIEIADGRIARIAAAGAARPNGAERIALGGALRAARPGRRPHPSRQDAARPALHPAPARRQRRGADRGGEGAAARARLSGRRARHAAHRAGRRLRHGGAPHACRHRQRGEARRPARAPQGAREGARPPRHPDRRLPAERA